MTGIPIPSSFDKDREQGKSSSSSSNTPPTFTTYSSYATSAAAVPYNRIANAAVAAASPLLGYLSGNANSIPSAPSTSAQGQSIPPAAIIHAATMSGSPSNVGHIPSSSFHGYGYGQSHQRSASYGSSGSNYTPATIPAGHTRHASRGTTNQTVSPGSNNNNNASAINASPMRRTPSLSEEDARKKESRNLDSIVSQFFSKASQVITQARFTHVYAGAPGGVNDPAVKAGNAPQGPKRARNKWFNIELDENDIFKDEVKTWRSVTSLLAAPPSATSSSIGTPSSPAASIPSPSPTPNLAQLTNFANVPSMVVEVILDVSDISPNQVLVLNNTREGKRFRVDLSGKGKTTHLHNPTGSIESSPKKCNIVLERWTLALKSAPPPGVLELPTVYKHCIILFRALYTLVRALPIYELQRRLKRRTGRSEIKIGCRLSTGEVENTSEVNSETDQDSEVERLEISLDTPLGDEDDASFSVQDFAFAPVLTPIGSLDLRCRYRTCVDFSVEEIEALLSSRFIDEDFFKPTMRKYSTSSGPGSLPIRGSAPSPVPQAYSQGQQRQQHYGSLSSARPGSQPIRLSPSNVPPANPDDGAFVGSAKARGSDIIARMSSGSPAGELSRRPSIGGSHPFKPSSPAPSPAAPRSYTTTPTHDIIGRYSSSPASVGPSSSLRYTVGAGTRTPSAGGYSGPSVSQLSYTKRSIPSPTSGQPPISGLTAMNLGSSPSQNPISGTSMPGSQPVPVPGTSGIPLSSSPTPSLIKRYSSSRYSRSFGQGSSGSSPGDPHGFWGPESIGRRSRLSSGHSREDIRQAMAVGSSGSGNRRIPEADTTSSEAPANSQDSDQIKSFLGMIDSRAGLPGGSILLGGPSSGGAATGRTMSRSTILNRLNAEEKLRNLADSVLRDSGRSPSNVSSTSSGIPSYQRPISSLAQGHVRTRSDDQSALPSSRQSPVPDAAYSASPVESQFANINQAAGGRPRASLPPMSTSIPEEEAHQSHGHLQEQQQVVEKPPMRSETSSMTTGSVGASGSASGSGNGGHFPFPRYVSASMRRRGSSQSSTNRPTISGQQQHYSISNNNSQPGTPDQVTSPPAPPEPTLNSGVPFSAAVPLPISPSSPARRYRASMVDLDERNVGASPDPTELSSNTFEGEGGGEEAAVAQLELGLADSREEESAQTINSQAVQGAAGGVYYGRHHPAGYRWGS